MLPRCGNLVNVFKRQGKFFPKKISVHTETHPGYLLKDHSLKWHNALKCKQLLALNMRRSGKHPVAREYPTVLRKKRVCKPDGSTAK